MIEEGDSEDEAEDDDDGEDYANDRRGAGAGTIFVFFARKV